MFIHFSQIEIYQCKWGFNLEGLPYVSRSMYSCGHTHTALVISSRIRRITALVSLLSLCVVFISHWHIQPAVVSPRHCCHLATGAIHLFQTSVIVNQSDQNLCWDPHLSQKSQIMPINSSLFLQSECRNFLLAYFHLGYQQANRTTHWWHWWSDPTVWW